MSSLAMGSVVVWVSYKGNDYGVYMEYEVDRQAMTAEVTCRFIDEWPQYPRPVLKSAEVDQITILAEDKWRRKEGYGE